MWIWDSHPLGSPFVSRFWVPMPTYLIPVARKSLGLETACNGSQATSRMYERVENWAIPTIGGLSPDTPDWDVQTA
ncbi:hypothetical protein BO78DRAFT_396832 [Aspergillus sclerotiicarbonarius CBS 121057]|uniref:Uncharacterized protein n=1 Tax=Aspergillus sclerotiicarbonarius (strain CBS 121057 / IBT 28362) TaxID=1448318 RepID=A0A319E9Z0_ASPSB|nr:hypothetical protein BO78DRAFT_396832 [Aspergillus sclerotiicarbonarius CBS 121057]